MRNIFLLLDILSLFTVVQTSTGIGAMQVCADGQVIVDGVCGDTSLATLREGWHKIEPGGASICAHGTPYAYWVRPGIRNDLLVYMQGGGGCWSSATCRDDGREFNGFYDSRVTERDSPTNVAGMLEIDNPDNPFADYTTIYIPVCTGDVHWGNNIYTYDSDVTINFKGFVNTSTALQWAYENLPNPDSIFVTGCSAGSAGSILHTPYIIEQYPGTPVYQLGDSLSLLFTSPVDLQTDWHSHDSFPAWIPELADMQPEAWTMAKFYTAIANYYPQYTFSQFNTVRDSVQVFYTYPTGGGGAAEWAKLLDNHIAEIQAKAPNYRAYTAGGNQHCITPRPDFYTYTINGIGFRDWIAAMASGQDIDSLHCADCERPEIRR